MREDCEVSLSASKEYNYNCSKQSYDFPGATAIGVQELRCPNVRFLALVTSNVCQDLRVKAKVFYCQVDRNGVEKVSHCFTAGERDLEHLGGLQQVDVLGIINE